MPKKYKNALCFDQAARLSGWAYFENEKPIEWGTIEPIPKAATGGERLRSLRRQFGALIKKYNPEIVVIENPVGGDEDKNNGPTANWQTLVTLAQVQGVLLEVIAEHEKPVEIVSPSSWVFTCRIHKRSRAERKIGAREFVSKEYKIDNVIQDVCDAVCIGYHFFETQRRKSEVSAF